jgi:hypothetical protein
MDCLACGPTSSPASREHVFSDWLLREFDPEISMALYRRNGDGTNQQVRQQVKLTNFRLKAVCTPCNNGWMSQLESSAKPLILGLIRGGASLISLADDERRLLAMWAAKTAIIESHSVGAACPVDAKYLRWMKARGTPGRCIVAASQTAWAGFGHLQVGIIADLIGGGTAAGNIILIALPKLVFACGFPMLEIPCEARCVKSLYTPLWPDPRSWRDMKQTAMPTSLDHGEMLAAMAERIELFQSLA